MKLQVSICRAIVAVGIIGALPGCDSWFGTEEAPPLPGERIAVMLQESDLDPDPRLSDLSVLLPKPYVNEAWPQAGGFPDHAMHHLELPEAISELWEVSFGAGSEGDQRILATPIVADGLIYTLDRDFEVRAFDTETGKSVWQHEIGFPDEDDEAFGGGIAYEDGRLFVSTGYAQLIALDARSGDELWRAPLTGPARAAPTVLDGTVIAVSIDNQTVALDAVTGIVRWTHAGFAENAGLLGGASPAAFEKTVIIPYSSGELYAIRLENGRVSWSDSLTSARRSDALSSLADIRGLPVVDRGLVVAISHAGRMVAIDLNTGIRSWDRRIGGLNQPWVAGEFIYVVTIDNYLAALTRRGGRVRWLTRLPAYEDPEDRSGAINWVGPVLAGDRLLVANNLGQVLAVSPYTGDPLGQVDVDDPVSVAPVVANGTLYIQTDGGRLHAYR